MAGLSSRRCHGLTTRGVRADRVGVAPSSRLPKGSEFDLPKGRSGEGKAGSASRRPLARETSAGNRPCRWLSASCRTPKTAAVLPVLGAGTRWSVRLRPGRSTGALGGEAVKGFRPLRGGADAGERGERSARAHVSSVLSHTRRGSVGPAVVLAGRVGCRSRRAASGPGSTDPGSSPWQSCPCLVRGPSSAGEGAPEAGPRWRKPRAHEQRHRWRAPRDPTRKARKRRACSGEGALVDGRRPGTVEPFVFDETAGETGPGGPKRKGVGSDVDPPRVVTGDVRGRVASSASGRERRRREVKRGGAVDRGSARTALHCTRERPGPRLRRALGRPSGITCWLRHRPKLEVRRQAKLNLVWLIR